MDLQELKTKILEDSIVDAEEITLIKETLLADGIIDRAEADFLFEINDAVTGKDNDAGYIPMFVELISDHVLKDETSPGVVDEDEAKYLMEKIGADGKTDSAELALLVSVVSKGTDVHESLIAYTAEAITNTVLEDGVIDASEVQMISDFIYGEGGSAGSGVSREEADLLFKLNDAVSGKENDPSWETLFVEAITASVLQDETSPGVIDDEEAAWLVERIKGDGTWDNVELAACAKIKAEATEIPEVLANQFNIMNIQ